MPGGDSYTALERLLGTYWSPQLDQPPSGKGQLSGWVGVGQWFPSSLDHHCLRTKQRIQQRA